MPRFLLIITAIAIMVYAAVDCYQAPRYRHAGAPRWLWMLLILLLPVMGAVLWLVKSRSAKQPAPLAPDDDPEFLRFLAERTRTHPDAESPGGNTGPRDEARRSDQDGDDRGADSRGESQNDSADPDGSTEERDDESPGSRGSD